jgi:TPR repeat protein
MRAGIAAFFLVIAPLAAVAQTTTVTITTSCPTPATLPDVPAPVTPSVAAGIAAARQHDFARARANFAPLAEKGDPDGQRALGQLLMQNCTGLQDKAAAVDWLTKAAAAGDVPAKVQLGYAYRNGVGVAQDDNKAFSLYTEAAAQSNQIAEMDLGYMYMSGRGTPQDRYQGLQWTVKAGEQGNAVALGNIALEYIRGVVLARDTERASFFLALANQRATLAQRNDLMGTAQEIRQSVSADDLTQASKRALRWTPGPGSLRDVLSDAEDFRKRAK